MFMLEMSYLKINSNGLGLKSYCSGIRNTLMFIMVHKSPSRNPAWDLVALLTESVLQEAKCHFLAHPRILLQFQVMQTESEASSFEIKEMCWQEPWKHACHMEVTKILTLGVIPGTQALVISQALGSYGYSFAKQKFLSRKYLCTNVN